jgi:uncharacterized membrane protein YheB (UPF0754 family)
MLAVAGLTLHHPWWIYVSMPFITALVGYGTKIVMIKMMFEPLEFKGLKAPWLGWQGQIPRHAAKMAGIAMDTMTRELLKPEELFDRLDPDAMVDELEGHLHDAVAEIVAQVVGEYEPGIWEALPDAARRALVRRVESRAPEAMRAIMESIRANVDRVFDIKHMVVTNLVRDKALLNRMFLETGGPTFRFLVRIGFPFGFIVGLVEAVVFLITDNHWLLPAFGLFTGAFTDFVALRMIFRPKQERGIGPFKWQGMFHKLRPVASQKYSELIANEILTPRAIMESLLTGPMSDQLFELIFAEVQQTIDDDAGFARPVVALVVGGRRYQEIKRAAAEQVIVRMPETFQYLEGYATNALDLANLLQERLALLDTDGYENLLRPAFKDDEWVVVAVGATLGFLVGELQTVLIALVHSH